MKPRLWYPMVGVLLTVLCVPVYATDYASPQLEQAIAASCKVSVPMGNGQFAGGSGCLYVWGDSDGRPEGYVVTAAHVVEGRRGGIVLRFGRKAIRVAARVVWAAPKRLRTIGGRRYETYEPADVAVLAFDVTAWPADEPMAQPIPFLQAGHAVPEGHAVYSLGYPSGAKELRLLTARSLGYDHDGHMLIYPGPELGRSGSAVITHVDGLPRIVGIVSTRQGSVIPVGYGQTRPDWRDTQGRLVTPAMIWRKRETAMIGQATQCGPMGCPTPGSPTQIPGMGDYHLLPYRQEQDDRLDRIERSQERSPGTVPLPPMAPPVDLTPLNARLSAVEQSVAQAIERSNEHSEAIGKLSVTAEKAVALAETIAGRDEAFARDLAAVRAEAGKADKALAVAGETQEEVAEALDADDPTSLLGRVQARIEGRVEDRLTGLKDTLSGMVGLPTFLGGTGLGLGGIAIIVAVLALLRRGAVNAAMGEPTLGQRWAGYTPNQTDDRITDLAAAVLARVGDRLPSVRRRKRRAEPADDLEEVGE